MKLDKNRNSIEKNGLTDSGEFTIEANAHAFQILSSGVYTNKLRAPIRELCCNAFDAQTANGNTNKPIEIKLPHGAENTFSVKDFGPGLSEEEVESIYSTYFKSTRNTSNAYTGGFGIGSKSPFAVVDKFTIESRQNGEVTTYEAYLDKERMPHIRTVNKAPTTEPSGLTVSFIVPKKEVKAFNTQAQEVFSAFQSPYKITDAPSNFPKVAAIAELPGDKKGNTLWLKDTGHYDRMLGVVMGNISYPLSTYANKLEKGKDLLLDWFMRQSAVINVPVGVLNVAASREDLSYDRKTLKALPALIHEEIKLFAKGLYEQAASKASTKYEIGLELRKLCGRYAYNLLDNSGDTIEAFATAGQWPDGMATFVQNGLEGLLPKTVKLAHVHPIINDLDHIFGMSDMRSSRFDRMNEKGGHSRLRRPVTDLASFFDALEEEAAYPRPVPEKPKSRNQTYDEIDFLREEYEYGLFAELGLPPYIMEFLEEPLLPYRSSYGYHDSERIQYITMPNSDIDEITRGDSYRHAGRFLRGGPINLPSLATRKLLTELIGAVTKHKRDSEHRGRERETIVMYPDKSISPKAFGQIISDINNEWGTSFDTGPSGLSDEVPGADKKGPAVETVMGQVVWDGAMFGVKGYMGGRPTANMAVNLLEDNEPYLFVTDYSRIFMHNVEALNLLLTTLGAPTRIIMVSKEDEAKLLEQGRSNGRSLRDFLENDLLPWAVEQGIKGETRYAYESDGRVEKLCALIAQEPSGAELPVIKELGINDIPAVDTNTIHTVKYLLDMCGLKLPTGVDKYEEVKKSYPFLAYRQLSQNMKIEQVIDYIRAIDIKRSLDNTLGQTLGQ